MLSRHSKIFSVFLVNMLLCLRMTLQTIQSKQVNISDLQYNFGLLCGPANNEYNHWNFPNVPSQLSPCPPCSKDKRCFRFENCCPEIEVQYPARVCTAPIVYQPRFWSGVNMKFLIINKCPAGSDIKTSNDCIKYRNVTDQIYYPPVTSNETYLTYRNKFCAICNGETVFHVWRIHLSPMCQRKIKPYSTVDDIVIGSIVNNCKISFLPSLSLSFFPKPCGRRYLVHSCNVTGTWSFYNKNIDYACQTFRNSFPPYQNIFCFMCNPPELSFIDSGKVLKGGRFEEACTRHGLSEAARPFKNIFCFLTSSQNNETSFKMTTFYVHVNEANFTYYVFDSKNKSLKDISSSFSYQIPSQEIETSILHYRMWEYKVVCQFPIPVSVLDSNITDFINDFAKSRNCSKQFSSNETFSLCLAENSYGKSCKNGTVIINIQLACQQKVSSTHSIIYGSYRDRVVHCKLRDESFLLQYDGITRTLAKYRMNQKECRSFECDDNQNMYPLHLFFCGCCKIRVDDIRDSNNEHPWFSGGIFNRQFYSPKCKRSQIFDPVSNICRTTGCFSGKHLTGSTCDFMLPLRMYRNQFEYLLPLTFYGPKVSGLHIALKDNLLIQNGIKTDVCSISNKQNESSHNVVIVSDAGNDHKNPEGPLLNFLETFIRNSSKFLLFEYDYQTKSINETVLENHCGVSDIPLLTQLLKCRHVLFSPGEYKISKNNYIASFDKLNYEIQFYEYEIDADRHLRICDTMFFEIIDNIGKDLVFVWIMVSFSVVSLISLILTLTTYCLFSKLRTLPGRNIMNLVFSLLAYNILYILVMVVDKPNTVVCQMLGILTHFFILSTFGSFTVCSVHMFRIFGQTNLTSALVANKGEHLSLIYFLSSYGTSALIVLIHSITLYVTSGMTLTGYGRNGRCFISGINSVIITFLVPLVLTFIVNLTLYIVTVSRLEKQRRVASDLTTASKSDRSDLCIFIKLFTTTGCSWILLIINFFIDSMPLYVVITGIQSLQGLYIFIAYICTKRIHSMYKCKFVRSPTEPQKQGRKTTTTSFSSDPSFDTPKDYKDKPLSRRKKKYKIQE